MTCWTLDDIRRAMNAAGSPWWEPSSMRFFDTRALRVHQGAGGIFLVTSEKPPYGPRRASVRHYDPATNRITTVEPFCAMSTRGAHQLAARLAAGDKVALDTHTRV